MTTSYNQCVKRRDGKPIPHCQSQLILSNDHPVQLAEQAAIVASSHGLANHTEIGIVRSALVGVTLVAEGLQV